MWVAPKAQCGPPSTPHTAGGLSFFFVLHELARGGDHNTSPSPQRSPCTSGNPMSCGSPKRFTGKPRGSIACTGSGTRKGESICEVPHPSCPADVETAESTVDTTTAGNGHAPKGTARDEGNASTTCIALRLLLLFFFVVFSFATRARRGGDIFVPRQSSVSRIRSV